MEKATLIALSGFLAVVLTGAATIAPGAHLYELLNKIALPKPEYLTVQKIYQGWWIAGLILPAALLANLVLAFVARHEALAVGLSLAAALLIIVNLAIFLVWTNPVNAVTSNWTIGPENWQALRKQWEYSHAVNAVVTFVAFSFATAAALTAVSRY
jgi:hypothetical protein